VVDVGNHGVHGADGGAEDRGHILETAALVVLVKVEAMDVTADEKVRPAITVVVDGVRVF
jgi:hypothetical protein